MVLGWPWLYCDSYGSERSKQQCSERKRSMFRFVPSYLRWNKKWCIWSKISRHRFAALLQKWGLLFKRLQLVFAANFFLIIKNLQVSSTDGGKLVLITNFDQLSDQARISINVKCTSGTTLVPTTTTTTGVPTSPTTVFPTLPTTANPATTRVPESESESEEGTYDSFTENFDSNK